MASLAQSTSTIIESGCKHIIPVRVSMETMLQFVDEDRHTRMRGEIFQKDKYKYCANKDDLLLCVDGHLLPQLKNTPITGKQAYPPVVSNLGDIPDAVKKFLCHVYSGDEDSLNLLLGVSGDATKTVETFYDDFVDKKSLSFDDFLAKIRNLPLLRFMGFSCGMGHVHPNNGDTVVSSYVGGMTTVRNGAFPVKAGDLVMWYFDFEYDYFDKDGSRVQSELDDEELDDFQENPRYKNMRAQNGWLQKPGVPVSASTPSLRGAKHNIFLPKPYKPDRTCNPMDTIRVFARALGNARPWDMMDLKICTIPVV